MKKRLSILIAGFLIISQTFMSFAGIPNVEAETPINTGTWNTVDYLHNGYVERVNIASDGTEGNGYSDRSSVSDNGRYIAFVSSADNLVQGDTNGFSDIFVRDRLSGETKRVSVASDGTQANGKSMSSSISADGRFVVFESDAGNLAEGDTDGEKDIFIHNLLTGETRQISGSSGGAEANGPFSNASISPDGRYVRFYVVTVVNMSDYVILSFDAFIYDCQTNKTEHVDENLGRAQGGIMPYSSFSVDGRYTVFISGDDGLVAGDDNGMSDIFIYDAQREENRRVSMAYDGTESNGDSYTPSISADGRFVVFESYASNLVREDNNDGNDIFVYDCQTSETARVEMSLNGVEGTGFLSNSLISADGKYITFTSDSWSLAPGDYNEESDVFITKNPLFAEENGIPLLPTDLKQRNESSGVEIGLGKIINEGAAESSDSVFLSAKVEDPDGGRVALEVQIESVDEVSGVWSSLEPIRSEYVASGEAATIDYSVPKGGLYTWRAKTVNEAGRESDWAHFGNNGIGAISFLPIFLSCF